MRFGSFRSRVLIGSALGALGLLPVLHLIFILLARFQPGVMMNGHLGVLLGITTVGLGFTGFGLMQVRRGLSPFTQLREQLTAVRSGTERQIGGTYPNEVQPLISDLNALLDHRERIVRRALAKAGDLAHGLKTPLAVLAQEAERAEAAGQHEIAVAIGHEVERMKRQIDYHLAQARAAASGATPGARCVVQESADALSRTLQRLHADRHVTIAIAAPAECVVRSEREDVDEMLGNLLDNACKWAKTRVALEAVRHNGRVIITIDDDGPGLAASMREKVLQRGVRADEAAPGSGLGLAIVRDLAELYGGSIALDDSPLRGLRARLDLPAS